MYLDSPYFLALPLDGFAMYHWFSFDSVACLTFEFFRLLCFLCLYLLPRHSGYYAHLMFYLLFNTQFCFSYIPPVVYCVSGTLSKRNYTLQGFSIPRTNLPNATVTGVIYSFVSKPFSQFGT